MLEVIDIIESKAQTEENISIIFTHFQTERDNQARSSIVCPPSLCSEFPLKSEGVGGAKAENVAGEKQWILLSGQVLITRFYATLTIEFLYY